MNRLNATKLSSWGEGKLLDFVYGLIDSKIDAMELRTRKLLEKFNRLEARAAHLSDMSESPNAADKSLQQALNEVLFSHFEELSRSIYVLEEIKLALREDNIPSVMHLLEDDNFLRVSEWQLKNVLNAAKAA